MTDALTFPLTLAEFFDGLPIRTMPFDLSENMQLSGTGGGEILTADRGPRLWGGTVEIETRTHAQMRFVEARARMLRQAGRSFFVTDRMSPYPAADPDGSTLGAATPAIHALDADNRRMRLKNLPAGYVLTQGDPLSFTYGSPTRYAYHQVISASVVADGTGITPLFEVSPFIRPGASVSTGVTLVKPFCKAVMVPGSFRPSTPQRGLSAGFAFNFIQTLR